MTNNGNNLSKLFFERLWPVVTAGLSALWSTSYTNMRLNSPESISIHPIAITLREEALKNPEVSNYVCTVDLEKLEEKIKTTNDSEDEAVHYLTAMVDARFNSVSSRQYPKVNPQNDLSFEKLVKDLIFTDCHHELNTALFGVGAAVVLSEKQNYLMSKNCKLLFHDRLAKRKRQQQEIPIKISVSGEPQELAHLNQTLPLEPPNLSVGFKVKSPPYQMLTKEDFDDYALLISHLQSSLSSGKPVKTSIECRVFFQDKVKLVGGDVNDTEVLPENT